MENLIESEKKEIALKILRDGKLQKEEVAKYFGFTLEQYRRTRKKTVCAPIASGADK